MSRNGLRGALIILEGCDKSGKTTQCKKLVEALKEQGRNIELMRFPERSTPVGKLCGDYLERKLDLEDHAIHLLFAANRWEAVPKMQKLLEEGTTLIVDRYSFSGVAFSASKSTMNIDWCKAPEKGLLAPDAVLYLSVSAEAAAKRASYGGERYEETDFQKTVAENYEQLKDSSWQIVDASRTVNDVHGDLMARVLAVMNDLKSRPIGGLWSSESGDSLTNGSGDSTQRDDVIRSKLRRVEGVETQES